MKRTLVMIGAATAVACSHPQATPARAEDPVSISLERGPCFGACPVYSVRVEGNGTVTFQGTRYVTHVGSAMDSVPRERVRALASRFVADGFLDYADAYVYGRPECGRFATDQPHVVTTVVTSGRTKRVEHDHGCDGAPRQLTALENSVDSLVGISRWTGSRSQFRR